MLSAVIQALKKVGYVPLYTFRKSLFGVQQQGFWITLHSSSARKGFILRRSIRLIGIRDSPDHQ